MKTSVVFFVGFFLLTCVGAKPQTALNTVGKHISDTATQIVKYDEEIMKRFWNGTLDVLPINATKEYSQQLMNSPQWSFVMNSIRGKYLQHILVQIQESQAYKMLMDYYNKIIECYDKALHIINFSQARKHFPIDLITVQK